MKEPSEERASSGVIVGTGIALLLLAVVSFAASYLRYGPWTLPIALCIALLKAGLVVAVFMELRHERASIQLTGLASVLMLLLVVALVVADVLTRSPQPHWPNEAAFAPDSPR